MFLGDFQKLMRNTRSHSEKKEKMTPSPADILQTAHICLLQSKRICAAIQESPTTNPSPATLLSWSGETQCGFMASGLLQRDA